MQKTQAFSFNEVSRRNDDNDGNNNNKNLEEKIRQKLQILKPWTVFVIFLWFHQYSFHLVRRVRIS